MFGSLDEFPTQTEIKEMGLTAILTAIQKYSSLNEVRLKNDEPPFANPIHD